MRTRAPRLLYLLLPCLLCSCGPSPHEGNAPGTVTIMSYALGGYGLRDRDGDWQDDDPKPPQEVEALLGIKRAGANAILTYFAMDAARWLAESE